MNDGWRNENNDADASDVYETRESRSWWQRIGDSLRGIVIGFVLFFAAIALLAWNEGRAVKTARALEEGAATVVSIASDVRDPAKEGRLVHIAGLASAAGPARDPELGVAAEGLKLIRTVEMYQWREERKSETVKKLGGGEETVTRYSYTREWSETPLDSSRFHEPTRHANPPMPGIRSQVFYAEAPRIGAFTLSRTIVDSAEANVPTLVTRETVDAARRAFGPLAQSQQGAIYIGDPGAPRVGDIRVRWRLAPAQEISVAGRQTGSAITPYRASNGREILISSAGVQSADVMFQRSIEGNQMLTWLLRGLGAIVMFIAVRMALSLAEVLASVLPPVGALVGAGASFVAFAVTVLVAPLVIATAWLFYRPLLAIGLFAAGLAAAVVVTKLAARRRSPVVQQAA